jgi:hypothetical protein
VTLSIEEVTVIITTRHDQQMYDREVAEAEQEARARAAGSATDGA